MTNESENVIAIDPLAERLRSALAKIGRGHKAWMQGREYWVDGTLELAAVVAESRTQYPDHRAFSLWLERNGLEKMSKDDRASLLNIAATDQVAMRQELLDSTSISWVMIWRDHRKSHPSNQTSKGKPAPKSRRSGHSQRQRAARIPDVMRDDWVRPVRPVVAIKGKSREEVDPDFKGNYIEYTAKYGPVQIHTKAEIEESKRQEVLSKWQGLKATALRATEAFLAEPIPEALDGWLTKPGKATKQQAEQDVFRRAVERLQPAPKEQIATSPDLRADESSDGLSLND